MLLETTTTKSCRKLVCCEVMTFTLYNKNFIIKTITYSYLQFTHSPLLSITPTYNDFFTLHKYSFTPFQCHMSQSPLTTSSQVIMASSPFTMLPQPLGLPSHNGFLFLPSSPVTMASLSPDFILTNSCLTHQCKKPHWMVQTKPSKFFHLCHMTVML